MKVPKPSSTLKKVVVRLLDQSRLKGYLNPATLGQASSINILTTEGAQRHLELSEVKSVSFVREFAEEAEAERKVFLSRPKLDGLWVRLKFRDGDLMEGIAANDILEFLDHGIQITPPDLHANTMRVYVPRTALTEMKVLGVVGVARRAAAEGTKSRSAVTGQSNLFTE